MYKVISLAISSLFLCTQCASVKERVETKEIEQSEVAFAQQTVYFNPYSAGVKGRKSGYELHFENVVVPDNIVLERAYFVNHTGVISKNANGYFARVQKIDNNQKDIVMSSDVNEEAVNTPPQGDVPFPFSLKDGQVGVQYLDKGEMKYTIIKSTSQREPVFYPSTSPKTNQQ